MNNPKNKKPLALNPKRIGEGRNALTELLYHPKKDFNVPMSPISRLIRSIFSDLNIRPPQFNVLLQQFLNDPNEGFNTQEARSSENGNIKKEFSRHNSTFKTLLKLTKVLNPTELEFSVKYRWHDGSETVHKTTVENPSCREGDALNTLKIEMENKLMRKTIDDVNKIIAILNDESK